MSALRPVRSLINNLCGDLIPLQRESDCSLASQAVTCSAMLRRLSWCCSGLAEGCRWSATRDREGICCCGRRCRADPPFRTYLTKWRPDLRKNSDSRDRRGLHGTAHPAPGRILGRNRCSAARNASRALSQEVLTGGRPPRGAMRHTVTVRRRALLSIGCRRHVSAPDATRCRSDSNACAS